MNNTVTLYFNDTFKFTANVSSPERARILESELSHRFQYDPSVEVFIHTESKNVDWAREEGTWIPLHLDVLEEPRQNYTEIIRFEDPSYMKYYSDHLWMGPGN